jgi:phospholipid/cholesterol/gamma-HCH transport system permease protein
MKNLTKLVELNDIYNGLVKAACFGLILSVIGCYKGFNCREGAQGVGEACTEAFVGCFISILALNYIFAVVLGTIYQTFWPLQPLL